MHPYHHLFLHRAPSRFLWFLVGAGVATCWHHSTIMRDNRAQYFPCVMQHRRVQEPPSDSPPQDPAPWKSTWGLDRNATGWHQQRDWEQDRERLRQLQKRAGESVRTPLSTPAPAQTESIQVADLSESTLDSIVAAAESLKAVRTHLLRPISLI